MKKRFYLIQEKKSKEISTDTALKCVAIFLLLFIISIEVIFCIYQAVPDVLVVGVLGTGGTEAICCVLVYLIKQKFKKGDGEDE